MTTTQQQIRLPAELGIWVFILGDLVIFGLLFWLFLGGRADNMAMFEQAQRGLNQGIGLTNTVLLLTSSLFVALGLEYVRNEKHAIARKCFTGGLACGAGFLTLKIVEYTQKAQSGFVIDTNDFYMYFYIMTGIHALHAIIGMAVLGTFIWQLGEKSKKLEIFDIRMYESGCVYWHMVDLLWIFLFTLIYLLG